MGNYRTPIIADYRKNGSTFYTFGSAMEDIGLNINERNNKVRLSHYVLLNLPKMQFNIQTGSDDCFSVQNFFENSTTGSAVLPVYDEFEESMRNKRGEERYDWFKLTLQNYMMNMETTLRNQNTYNHAASETVTERCFWKFLQKAGAINFDGDEIDGYYHEKWDNPENTVIKGFGAITSSSQSSNSYNINNETYIMVPSSYGQMKYILEPFVDDNILKGAPYSISEPYLLEGHKSDEDSSISLLPLADNSLQTAYISNKDTDMLHMVFDVDTLFDKLIPEDEKPTNITYDELGINENLILGSEYDFNAVLVYYTIYDSNFNSIGTNLFGLLLINDLENVDNERPVEEGDGAVKFGSLTKVKSTDGQFGSSYFFRLNIQTASIYDKTNDTIIDFSSAESSTLTDFNDVMDNLKTTVDILKNNAVVLANMYNDVQATKEFVAGSSSRMDSVEQSVKDLMYQNVREINAKNVDTTELNAENADIQLLAAKDASIETLYVKNIISDNTSEQMLSVTYDDLVELVESSQLVPGTRYRIIDYRCTTTQDGTQAKDYQFDIIVVADSNSILNENAYAAHHEGDTHFQNCKLEAWELKYSIKNDSTRFAWADPNNGKGVIWYMKDEHNNEAPYDFKNIQFAAYAYDGRGVEGPYNINSDNLSGQVVTVSPEDAINRCISMELMCDGDETFVINLLSNPIYMYTFTYAQNGQFDPNHIEDFSSLDSSQFEIRDYSPKLCFGNKISMHMGTTDIDGTTYPVMDLPNVIFVSYKSGINGNTIAENCKNIIITASVGNLSAYPLTGINIGQNCTDIRLIGATEITLGVRNCRLVLIECRDIYFKNDSSDVVLSEVNNSSFGNDMTASIFARFENSTASDCIYRLNMDGGISGETTSNITFLKGDYFDVTTKEPRPTNTTNEHIMYKYSGDGEITLKWVDTTKILFPIA